MYPVSFAPLGNGFSPRPPEYGGGTPRRLRTGRRSVSPSPPNSPPGPPLSTPPTPFYGIPGGEAWGGEGEVHGGRPPTAPAGVFVT